MSQSERKYAAVLFADIVGFTSMSEKMDPEAITDIMNQCFAGLEKCIHRYEGTVDKYMGDCVMAVFGAPISHENDPERAIRTALEMLEELDAVNQSAGVSLGLSIGINAGEVLAGEVGGEKSKAYTVMGDTVNVAQRLESAAGAGEIMVSESVYRSTQQEFDFSEQDPIRLKGKAEPVKVYTVSGLKKTTTASMDSPFVGRENERVELQNMAKGYQESRTGVLVGVMGEAGIGKSRFRTELQNDFAAQGMGCLVGKASRVGESLPYASFIDMLRFAIGLGSGDAQQDITRLLEFGANNGLSDHDKQALAYMLGLASEEALAQLDAKARRLAIFLAVRKVLERISEQAPTVFIFEDLQWADPLTRDLLDFLVDSLRELKLFFICLYRPAFTHTWDKHAYYRRYYLQDLSVEDSNRLIDYHLGQSVPPSLKRTVRERTQGNPLFIEEFMGTLKERMAQMPGNADPKELESFVAQIPATIHGLIASRIDRLPTKAKYVLQTASVIGRSFEEQLLRNIFPENELEGLMDILLERNFLFEKPNAIEREYHFRHLVIKEVAYQSLLQKHRVTLHATIGKAIEVIYSERLTEFYEPLAHHFEEAGESFLAARYHINAGDRSRDQYDNPRAIEHMGSALKLLEDSTKEDSAAQVLQMEALIGRGFAKRLQGKYSEAIEDYKNAESIVRKLGDGQILAEILGHHARACYFSGHYQDAITNAIEGYKLAEQHNNPKAMANCSACISGGYFALGDLGKTEEFAQKTLEIRKQLGDKGALAQSLSAMGLVQQRLGAYEEAARMFKESLAHTEEIGDKTDIASTLNNLGSVYRVLNQFELAANHFSSSLDICHEIGNYFGMLTNLCNLGELYLFVRNLDEAEKVLTESYESSQKHGHKAFEAEAQILLGLVHAFQENPQGLDEVKKGLELAETVGRKDSILIGQYYLGLFWRDKDDEAKAKDYLESSIKIAQEIQMKEFEELAQAALAALSGSDDSKIIPITKTP